MSKGVFINSLDTYIGLALYEELLGENPEESEFEIYGTYFNKEVSERPKYVKKMLKLKEKPNLFRQYMLNKMDYFIYDLHSGKLSDLEWGIKALTREPLEAEKTVIVISSVLSWGGNPHYMVEDKLIRYDEEGNPIEEKYVEENIEENIESNRESNNIEDDMEGNMGKNNIDDNMEENNMEGKHEEEEMEEEDDNEGDMDEMENMDNLENNNNDNHEGPENSNPEKPKKKKKKAKKLVNKEIKYKRIGHSEEEYAKRIPCEYYSKIKEFEDHLLNLKIENLNIVIICAGIPYGNCETVFNYFFKSAWLQNPEVLPYFPNGDNLLPTIHVKDLAKITKKLLGTKPEIPYIFAIDQTIDKSVKNIIRSISRGIGSGITRMITPEEEEKLKITLDSQDYYIDQSLYSQKDVQLILTEGELNWTNYLKYDIMLNPSKFIEEDFEWHCKEGIPEKIDQLLSEFAKFRRLRPLKIVLNCSDKNVRSYFAKRLSEFYNMPIVNYEKIIEMLGLKIEELSEEEEYMKKKYLILKEKMEFINSNPDFVNEENLLLCDPTEILMEALKFLLKENACKNRGYILEGMPVNMEEVKMLYFYKSEIVPEGDEDGMDMSMEEEEENIDMENMGNIENMESMDIQQDNMDMDNMNDMSNMSHKKSINNISNMSNNDSNPNPDHNPDSETIINLQKEELKQAKKKKKKKPKHYKVLFDKSLIPESVITISFKNKNSASIEVDNIFWEVENFYQENNIEILNLLQDEKSIAEEKANETFEMMRIYIERNSRPFNYFKDTDADINYKRENYLKEKVRNHKVERENQMKKEEEIEAKKEKEFWIKMEKRIESIKKDQEEIDYFDDCPTRKFLLLNIMPILTKGMLEVCKINPIDPVDYLADFLFKNYSD